MNTDARELSDEELYNLDEVAAAFARKHLNDERLTAGQYKQWVKPRREHASMGVGNVFNGSTKFINVMVSVNVILLAGAISGAVWFAVEMSGRMSALEANVSALKALVDLIVSGHIK